MKRREGVCQDFAHLMVSALRGLGLPARYISGYIRTKPPPGQQAPAGRRSVARLGRLLAGAGAWLGRSGSDQRHRGARMSTCCWAGAAITATSARCGGSSWAAATIHYRSASIWSPT